MTIFDIMSELENDSTDLAGAKAVLEEICHYFEMRIEPGSDEAAYLAMCSEHINLLLGVVLTALFNTEKTHRTLVDALMEHHKAQKYELDQRDRKAMAGAFYFQLMTVTITDDDKSLAELREADHITAVRNAVHKADLFGEIKKMCAESRSPEILELIREDEKKPPEGMPTHPTA